MVKFTTASAAIALASVCVVTAAPAPPEQAGGTIIISHRTREEGLAFASENLANLTASDFASSSEERQAPAFGAWFEHYDFLGAARYHTNNIDGRGYYIGDDWNDRISSIRGFDYDKKCSYWTEYQWDVSYCWGSGIIVEGRVEFARLNAPFNDAISCIECSWN